MSHGDGASPGRFAELLRQHRVAAALTQETLAERAQLSAKAVSLLERGRRRNPHRATIDQLADALDLTPDDRAEFVRAGRSARGPAAGADIAHNLPFPTSAMVGRDADTAAVVSAILDRGARLVTLTGTPGVGKTSLALAASHQLLDRFPDGTWFTDLSGIDQPHLVPATIGSAIGALGPTQQPGAALLELLGSRRALLVIDNCEHLLGACAELVSAVLAASPHVTVLGTSREALRISGEHDLRVEPLATPASGVVDVEALLRVPAVELFVDRARAVDKEFRLSAANAAAVAELCRRLDGLPLAIELAAQQLRLFSTAQLVAQLDDGLTRLTTGARDAPPRQRTLHDSIRASYALLRTTDQAVFRRLSVFAGGIPLDAVAEVSAAAGPLDDDPVTILGRLVSASLLHRQPDAEPVRLRMLATIRAFAADQLRHHDEATATSRARADYFAGLVGKLAAQMNGPLERSALERLGRERDNLRAVLAWARSDAGDANLGLAMASSLWQYWWNRGELVEARTTLEALLAKPPGDASLARAAALRTLGNIGWATGKLDEAAARYEQSLAIYRQLGDDLGAAKSTMNLGLVANEGGRYDTAATHYGEALALARRVGDSRLAATTLAQLGAVAYELDDLATAIRHHTEALQMLERSADLQSLALAEVGLGALYLDTGDRRRARRLTLAGMRRSLELGQRAVIARGTFSGGRLELADGHHERAHTLFTSALRLLHEQGETHGVADTLTWLGTTALEQGDPAHAARLIAAAVAAVPAGTRGLSRPNQLQLDKLAAELADTEPLLRPPSVAEVDALIGEIAATGLDVDELAAYIGVDSVPGASA